jgi:hypothetical protein
VAEGGYGYYITDRATRDVGVDWVGDHGTGRASGTCAQVGCVALDAGGRRAEWCEERGCLVVAWGGRRAVGVRSGVRSEVAS